MKRNYEIVMSKEDLKEKETLGIEYPYYKDKYLDIVRIFLENSKRIEQNRQENATGKKEIFNAYEKFPNDMSNIITIVGGRGTGKTTALQEIRTIFMEFGNDNLEKKEEWVKRLGMPHSEELREQAKQTFRISAMEVIDASALEEQDDLLEIILWHICNEVRKKSDAKIAKGQYGSEEWERQEFLDTLDEVYRMHQSVKGKSERIAGGESVLTALDNMPNSIKTRTAMHKLLDLYCKIMFPGNEQSTYLVIAIDDLDLNIKNSYQILEEIRRYLLDWRIVILLAVDNKQMEEVCITHFYNDFEVARNRLVEQELAKHIHDLSNCYLLKAMAIPNRVYLSEENLKTAQIVEENGKKLRSWDVKKYLLLNIAPKMHIFYDAYGLKKHFCEPDNIRELITYIEFLKSLHTVSWDVPEGEEKEKYLEQQLEYYNQNYMRFCQDIVERMAFQVLQFEQHDIFLNIRRRGLERRTGYVIQYYKNFMKRIGIFKSIDETEHYDFGDLLECIYIWGRADYEYKALMCCLLASFTAEMTKEYFNHRFNLTDSDSAEHSQRRLEGYVGDNISGKWLSEAMGNVFWTEWVKQPKENKDDNEDKNNKENKKDKANNNDEENNNGEENNNDKENRDNETDYEMVNKKNQKLISIEKEKELQYIQFTFSINQPQGSTESEKCLDILDQFIDCKILPILECIFLCLNNYKKVKGGSICKPQIEAEQESKLTFQGGELRETGITLKIRISNAFYADFDIFGFVRNSIDYMGWRDDVGKKLVEVLKTQAIKMSKYEETNNDMSEEMKEKILAFEKTSVFGEMGLGKNEMALPLYNLDLSYNLFKRVRRSCLSEFSMPIEINGVHDRIKRIYKMIEEELQHEEDEYTDFQQNENKFMYKNNFVNDPYIKKFKELLKDEFAKDEFLKQMKILYLSSGKLESLEQISPSLNM